MMIQNKTKSPFNSKGFYNFQANGERAELFVYDEIGVWGVTAQQFINDLKAASGGVDVRINSPGGSYFDGVAMMNAMKRHGDVNVFVDGLAASAASVIAMGGKTVTMAESAFLMIHEPWSIVAGPASAMRKEADVLDEISASLAKLYARNSDTPEDEIRQLVEDETWLDAEKAVELGFADQIGSAMTEAASVAFDLRVYGNTPQTVLDAYGEMPAERQFENNLRDAGCSRKQAKTLVSDMDKLISNVKQRTKK